MAVRVRDEVNVAKRHSRHVSWIASAIIERYVCRNRLLLILNAAKSKEAY